MTGEEEYEIDTFDNITDETRSFLVDNKLTTVGDLSRFKNKWVESTELEEDQVALLMTRVEEYEAADEEVSLLKRNNFKLDTPTE